MAKQQCVESVEFGFGIIELSERIKLMAGDLYVYRLIEGLSAEVIIELFKLQKEKLGITAEQFFYGSNQNGQAIGFVLFGDDEEFRVCERIGDLWTPSDRNFRSYRRGTEVFAPVSRLEGPCWKKTVLGF